MNYIVPNLRQRSDCSGLVQLLLSCCAFKTHNLISRFGDWGLGTGDWEDPELPLPHLPTPNSLSS